MMLILTWLIRMCALVALVLGIVFWSGNAPFLIPVHVALGIILTLSLILAGILVGIARGGNWGLMIGAFLLSIVVVPFGLRQSSLLTGELHWIIRVIHLLLGISMVLYVGILTKYYKHMQKGAFA
jgi:hypothetical protein